MLHDVVTALAHAELTSGAEHAVQVLSHLDSTGPRQWRVRLIGLDLEVAHLKERKPSHEVRGTSCRPAVRRSVKVCVRVKQKHDAIKSD